MAAAECWSSCSQTATRGQRDCNLQVAAQGSSAQIVSRPLLAALQRLTTE